MSGFIPEITTRVSVKMETKELDEAISRVGSDPILSDILLDELEEIKDEFMDLQEPLVDAVADRLSSNQETIISTKHYITGMMSNSVDISQDGEDRLVGNTAMSPTGFPYPLAIEQGTSSHWVAPVTFDALHWSEGGTDYFSKGHTVSGIKADPFVEPSINLTMDDIDEIWDSLAQFIR